MSATVADQPVGPGLDEDVAERRRLGRARHHRQPAGVGGELAQQRVAGAAADDVHDVDGVAGQPLRVRHRPRGGPGRGSRGCSG